ncbi:hypothetical protein NF27_GI00020 [Candidatus Jidaibacter acanthamoeba]|uniref:HTH cro/C1-type domain-containing protein n=1 Tax=Candidatus Jidaibacter acanthamoebae TaxID=86105 RepID=A0A0C1MRL4_9RICK|nr:hypothetical protein [Candidatus Jidaibacter acanthamoeba]KIE04697.1 hypothetical protein NF27_GI00020 [Candidatus Jidaibacter acanthamoeba]
MDEIGEIIRRVLFFRKITTTDFAEHIGISRKTLENGLCCKE